MIIDLPANASRRQMRQALLRAAEALKPKNARPKRIAELEQSRMAEKVSATDMLAEKLREVVAAWETAFYKRAKILKREADDGTPKKPKLTPAQQQALLAAAKTLTPKQMEQVLLDVLGDVYDNGSEYAFADISSAADDEILTLDNIRAKAAIKKRYIDFATEVTDDQQAVLKNLLISAFDDNTPTDQLAEQISSYFRDGVHRKGDDGSVRTYNTDAWSTMVARTEVSYAQNTGIVDYYREAGVEKLMWVAAADACDECDDLDGEVTDLDGVFEGTDLGMPPAHPMCRCTVVSADVDQKSNDGDHNSDNGEDGGE